MHISTYIHHTSSKSAWDPNDHRKGVEVGQLTEIHKIYPNSFISIESPFYTFFKLIILRYFEYLGKYLWCRTTYLVLVNHMNYDFPGSKKSPVTSIFTPNELEGSTGNNESSQHSGAYIFRPKRQQDGFRISGWEVSWWVEKWAFEEFEKWSSAFLRSFFLVAWGPSLGVWVTFPDAVVIVVGPAPEIWSESGISSIAWDFQRLFLCGVWFPSPRNQSHNIPCPDTRSLGLSPCIQIGGVVIHSWTGRLKISTVLSFCDPRCQTMKIGLLFQ